MSSDPLKSKVHIQQPCIERATIPHIVARQKSECSEAVLDSNRDELVIIRVDEGCSIEAAGRKEIVASAIYELSGRIQYAEKFALTNPEEHW